MKRGKKVVEEKSEYVVVYKTHNVGISHPLNFPVYLKPDDRRITNATANRTES